MPSILQDTLFAEPSGWKQALVQYGSAVLFVGLFVYMHARDTTGTWVLLLATANVLSGTAEILPSDRRTTAGALRLSAILVCLSLFGFFLLAPDWVLP